MKCRKCFYAPDTSLVIASRLITWALRFKDDASS